MPAFRETIRGNRGGFRKPVQAGNFILDWLRVNGQDCISVMHQEYYKALTEAGQLGGRFYQDDLGNWKGKPYRNPTYHSFKTNVENLVRQGLVEVAGSEESPATQFDNWPERPKRNLYRLTGAQRPTKTPKKTQPKPPPKATEDVTLTRKGNVRDIKPLRGRTSSGELPLQGRRTRK